MRAYAINYDLKAPGRNYEGLYAAIKELGTWWHYLESMWIVKTSLEVNGVWERLARHLDENDRLLVIEVRCNAQGWLPKEAWDWIHKNVPAAS